MSVTEFLDRFDACRESYECSVANCRDMDDLWATAQPNWIVWIATRPGVLDDSTLRRFAVWSARHVQHLMTDARSLAAIEVAERHADGKATDEELAEARSSASAAASAAAWAAARDAASAAAWAAQAAARDAARDSARDSVWAAARDIEWDDAQAAQAAWLRANATPDWERVRRKMGGAK